MTVRGRSNLPFSGELMKKRTEAPEIVTIRLGFLMPFPRKTSSDEFLLPIIVSALLMTSFYPGSNCTGDSPSSSFNWLGDLPAWILSQRSSTRSESSPHSQTPLLPGRVRQIAVSCKFDLYFQEGERRNAWDGQERRKKKKAKGNVEWGGRLTSAQSLGTVHLEPSCSFPSLSDRSWTSSSPKT